MDALTLTARGLPDAMSNAFLNVAALVADITYTFKDVEDVKSCLQDAECEDLFDIRCEGDALYVTARGMTPPLLRQVLCGPCGQSCVAIQQVVGAKIFFEVCGPRLRICCRPSSARILDGCAETICEFLNSYFIDPMGKG